MIFKLFLNFKLRINGMGRFLNKNTSRRHQKWGDKDPEIKTEEMI